MLDRSDQRQSGLVGGAIIGFGNRARSLNQAMSLGESGVRFDRHQDISEFVAEVEHLAQHEVGQQNQVPGLVACDAELALGKRRDHPLLRR